MFSKSFLALCAFLVCIASHRAAAACDSTVNIPKSSRYLVQFFFKANWFQASRFCNYHGLQLASVLTREDSLELQAEVKKVGLGNELVWLGGNDWSNYGKFNWASNGQPFSYTSWALGQPDNANGNEHCMQLVPDAFIWNDNDCSKPFYFVCERVCR